MHALSFALKYKQQSYSVIPLKPGSKVPFVNSWEPYQKIFASEGQLDSWFSNGHAGNNIAIVTGKISRIIAFDIDGEEALARFNRAIDRDEEYHSKLFGTMKYFKQFSAKQYEKLSNHGKFVQLDNFDVQDSYDT